jgi:predicted nucleic acid-binding protein
VRFWDSSAIVPLILEEPPSRRCRELLRRDPVQVVWCLSRTEVLSALWRQHRIGALEDADLERAVTRLETLAARWAEVDAVLLVRETGERLLRTHSLRAADALQLGAALVAAEHRPRNRSFVCLDGNLLGAASREGFDVIRPET